MLRLGLSFGSFFKDEHLASRSPRPGLPSSLTRPQDQQASRHASALIPRARSMKRPLIPHESRHASQKATAGTASTEMIRCETKKETNIIRRFDSETTARSEPGSHLLAAITITLMQYESIHPRIIIIPNILFDA
jgi:hypothetical protein